MRKELRILETWKRHVIDDEWSVKSDEEKEGEEIDSRLEESDIDNVLKVKED